MHQKTRKLKFFAVFSPLTYVFPLFLLILGSIADAQDRASDQGVRFNNENFNLDLPVGFERRPNNTTGVILSVRYRGSFPTLNIVESPGSSKYPSHLSVEQRVLESYRAVGIQEPKLISVKQSKFGSIDLSEPLVSLGYKLNEELLKAEVGFINLKNSYLTITLVERALAQGDEVAAGSNLRESLKWIGSLALLDDDGADKQKGPAGIPDASISFISPMSAPLVNYIRQILGLLGIVITVFIIVKVKNLLWNRIFK